jgi:hypothetical protein
LMDVLDVYRQRGMQNERCDGVGVSFNGDSSQEEGG